ncbi:oxidoreductase [Luteimicrobium subarcticum]|uniref:Putative dehydrogenase n=1 Tax=Luteimicrobium subarcticum TaxID=620910 RepID=A0A2M8WJU4_9MICO|nr:oxidoreductase [Luteimicrobium subarcticum]PJI91173.1 putative dehydrogenase [Luteimicrobium subarcticum]
MSAPEASTRVALVGYGFAGRTFHAPLILGTSGLELTTVVSGRPDAVHADLPDVDVVPDLAAALEDDSRPVDLVVVATPNTEHLPLAAAALEAGRHVVVDKPFTLTLDDARTLRDLAHRQHRFVTAFHNRRWDSEHLGLRALLDSGVLGAVTHLDAHFDRFRPEVRDRWRERAEPGSGVWFDLGPHLVDQVVQLFGVPETVTLDAAALRPGARTDDWAHAVLRYDGLRVTLHATLLAAAPAPRLTVHGTQASAVKQGIDQQEAQLLVGTRPGDPGWGEDPDPIVVHLPDGSTSEVAVPAGDHRAFYAGVREAVRGAGPLPVTVDESLAVMAVLEAGVVSAAEGRSVVPALTDEERLAVGG